MIFGFVFGVALAAVSLGGILCYRVLSVISDIQQLAEEDGWGPGI